MADNVRAQYIGAVNKLVISLALALALALATTSPRKITVPQTRAGLRQLLQTITSQALEHAELRRKHIRRPLRNSHVLAASHHACLHASSPPVRSGRYGRLAGRRAVLV